MLDVTPYLGSVRAVWLSLPSSLRVAWAVLISGAMLWAAFSWASGMILLSLLSSPPGSSEKQIERRKKLRKVFSKPYPELSNSWWRSALSTISFGLGGQTFVIVLPVACSILAVFTFLDLALFQGIRDRDKPSAFAATGRDRAGLEATYKVIMVSGEYYWKYGDTATVVNFDGREIPLESKLQSNGIAALLRRSTDIIAVGTASCVGGGVEEESRASERARTLVGWVKQVDLGPEVENVFLLNLGQYDEPCGFGPRETEQRVVLIVGVTNKEPGVDITESFRNAIISSRGIPRRLDLQGYANWPELKFILEPAM